MRKIFARPAILVALGLAQTTIYLAYFLRPFPLADWWQHPRLDYAWLTQYELSGQLRFVGAFGVLFALYYWAVLHLREQAKSSALGPILAFQVLMGLVLVGMYPIAAIDLYDYVLYGRLGLYWGANPLAHPPSEFPGEPLVGYSYWPNERSVYGPLWQLVSMAGVGAVDGQLLPGLYAFKLIALGSAVGTTGLIWIATRRLRPELAAAGAALYAWNPLQLFETAGNGHNDALMVLFLALALLLLTSGRRLLSLPAFTLGLLVKIGIAPLAPLFGLTLLGGQRPWRLRLRDFGLGLALSAFLVLLVYAPFWEGRASLPFLDRGGWFTASPPTLFRELFRRWQDLEAAGKSAATLSAIAFGLVALLLSARMVAQQRQATDLNATDALVRASYHLYFAYLVLACLWWQPWYLLVLLPLAAISGDRQLADRTTLFCIGGLLSYPVFKYIWAVHQADWHLDYFKIMALSVVVIFTLPLVHLAVCLARSAGRTEPLPGAPAARPEHGRLAGDRPGL